MNSNLPRSPIGQGDDRPWPNEAPTSFSRKLKLVQLTLTCLMLMTAATCGFAQESSSIAEATTAQQTQTLAQK
jgi:hypothetical protein